MGAGLDDALVPGEAGDADVEEAAEEQAEEEGGSSKSERDNMRLSIGLLR